MRHLRLILLLLFISISLSLAGSTYYVSSGGKDSNPGTISQPFFTLNKAWSVISAGDIIYMRGGTYNYGSTFTTFGGKSGTSGNYINVWAYPGEYPVIDYSSHAPENHQHFGIYIHNADYVYLKGIRITSIYEASGSNTWPNYGIMFGDNSNNCIVEQMETDHIGGWGLTVADNCNNNLFLNCDSHHNQDPYSSEPYGGSDGFQCYSTSSTGNTFRGCRAWANSDDGWDLRGTDGLFILENCWSFWNGYIPSTVGSTWVEGGNGIGLKLAGGQLGTHSDTRRIVRNCLVFENRIEGMNGNPTSNNWSAHEIYNNTVYGNVNGVGMIFQYGSIAILKNNISYKNNGEYDIYNNISNVTHNHNSYDAQVVLTDADFLSVSSVGLDGPRQADGSLPVTNFLKLAKGSDLIDAGVDVGLPYDNKAPDLGAFEFLSGAPTPSPVFISTVVENSTPAVIGMTYDLILANIVPAVSAFSVKVNSTARTINSVTISGTKVLLTLSSPVINGDVVTVAYTKPATNPLQTASGGQAASLSTQTVVNNVSPAIPTYVSSVIQNATPSTLEISFNLSLAMIIPAASAFSVKVNSVARTVNTVTISGTKVLLTLSNPVINGDVVTISYTRPATNPIQTSSGGQAATLSAQAVTNNVIPGTPPLYVSSAIENATPGILEMTYNLTLANIIPAPSAFTVSVNSLTRTVNTVTLSGTKVLLTLASPVVYGDIVTVGYTKPASNPLQTPSAGLAASISAQPVANRVNNPTVLGYINSAIGNASPTKLEINYNLSLANILPAVSAFSVTVNSVAINVSSVSIIGSSVNLILPTAVVYGDVITVAYNKPATNPIQSNSGLEAATMGAQSITNKVDPVGPVYVSSEIENLTPNILVITYNETLDLTAPDASAFVVMVNGVKRGVTFVFISGNKVKLTLASPVVFSDVVTVSYIKPANNQLKKASGETAASFSFPQPVKNTVADNSIKKKNITIYPNPAREFINVCKLEASSEPKIIKIFDFTGKLCSEIKVAPYVSDILVPISLRSGNYLVQIATKSLILFTQKLIVMDY